jgi:hypothetical protein
MDIYHEPSSLLAKYRVEKKYPPHSKEEEPYIHVERIVVDITYNPNYGDDRICKCGHPYYRHFDWMEEMSPVGCKYCDCDTFVEAG